MPSPTSNECRAAWQSISVAKAAGLPRDSVIVIWDSALPVREARAKLAIFDTKNGADETIVISIIGHPRLKEINPTAPQMRQLIRQSAVLLQNAKHEIQAVDVAFIEADESVVRFVFPRPQLIQSGDKEFLFRFEILDSLVEAKFSIKDMTYAGTLAL